jgi:hypothetical protein
MVDNVISSKAEASTLECPKSDNENIPTHIGYVGHTLFCASFSSLVIPLEIV